MLVVIAAANVVVVVLLLFIAVNEPVIEETDAKSLLDADMSRLPLELSSNL